MNNKPAKTGLNLSIGTKIMLVLFFIFTLIICTCAYQGFVTEKDRIVTSYSKNIEQSETAITTSVSLVARGTELISSIYDSPMGDALNQMNEAYIAAGGDPAKMDLSLLRAAIQEDFNEDVELYIIDADNVIIDTTDLPQMGADFSDYPAFSERLTTIREGFTYIGDPWEQSVLDTELIRKYAYLPTADHRYILEIGLFNEQLADSNTIFFSFGDVTEELEAADTAIESVLILDRNGVYVEKSAEEVERWYDAHQYLSREKLSQTTAEVLSTGAGVEMTFPEEERMVHIFLIDPGYGSLVPSDIVYATVVVYSTEELNASLADTLRLFILILLCGLVFAGGVAYIVAYTLGRPVKMIAEDVDEIAKGNLSHEIRRTNGYELRRLEDSIRILVKRLGDDITEIQEQKKTLNTELNEKTNVENRLRNANRKLSLLSTITRHDILNQLAVLGMYCDILDGLTDRCPEISEYNSRMEQTLAKIERQLTFARDYESMGIEEPRFQLLTDVVQNALISIHAPYLHFTVDTDGAEICADPMLEKVFYNLFENAIRHGGDSLTEITVSFTATPGQKAQITVTDNGDGIAEAKKEKIFRQGYGSNTGYGLFLVAEILAGTGITIRECGKEGEGARFEMEVPPAFWRQHV